jgi:hypothetical protein
MSILVFYSLLTKDEARRIAATLRNCRTFYSDETGIPVAAFSNRRVGNLDAKASGLASGPGLLDAPNQSSSGATQGHQLPQERMPLPCASSYYSSAL